MSAYTNKQINDYDIYFSKKESADTFIECLKLQDRRDVYQNYSKRDKLEKESFSKNLLVFETDNAITFISKKQKYQVIKAFYLEPEDLFKKYDFTICMAAYSPLENIFYLFDSFLQDVSEKRLKFNIGTEYPICSLLRVLKYQKKGYTINGLELIKLSLTIHALKLDNYAELKRQLQGIDTLFLKDLTDTLSSNKYRDEGYDFNKFIEMFDEYLEQQDSIFFKGSDNDEEIPEE